MDTNQLINLASRQRFRLGPYEIVSQQPHALAAQYRKQTIVRFLPQFMLIWRMIEEVTGHRWKCTSYIRESPSHRRGQAFDLAPDIARSAEQQYAVTHNSDPVLYKREPLIRALQSLVGIDFSGDGSNKIGLFIEPDHIHIQILRPDDPTQDTPTAVVKWKVAKPLYPDTYERMSLPMFS